MAREGRLESEIQSTASWSLWVHGLYVYCGPLMVHAGAGLSPAASCPTGQVHASMYTVLSWLLEAHGLCVYCSLMAALSIIWGKQLLGGSVGDVLEQSVEHPWTNVGPFYMVHKCFTLVPML